MVLQVVEVKSGKVLRTLPGDTEPVTSIAVHPAGNIAVVSSRSLVTKLWSTDTGRCIRTWKVQIDHHACCSRALCAYGILELYMRSMASSLSFAIVS